MQTLPAEERRCMADVRAAGMSLAEFGALSSNVGLHTVTHFADRSSLREFKEAIWEALGCGVGCGNGVGDSHRHTPFGGRGGTHVVVSFNRTALKQTGEGHFSPLGGYSRRHSAVLVMVLIAIDCCCSLAHALRAGCRAIQVSALLGAAGDALGRDASARPFHRENARVSPCASRAIPARSQPHSIQLSRAQSCRHSAGERPVSSGLCCGSRAAAHLKTAGGRAHLVRPLARAPHPLAWHLMPRRRIICGKP